MAIGSVVEVVFKRLAHDEWDIPPELAAVLQTNPKVRQACGLLSAGKQRGPAYMVASAKRSETPTARLERVCAILVG